MGTIIIGVAAAVDQLIIMVAILLLAAMVD